VTNRQAIPEVLCVDGYIRVSRVGERRGERFISPAAQREAIDGWATRCGARVLTVFEELDWPGSTLDRPMLRQAVERIEDGISHGLVVDKVDRFSRSSLLGLLAIHRIQAAGGTVFAVHDGLDTTTDAGRMVLRNLLSNAEWELDRRRTGWDTARRHAISRGVHIGSSTPIGYRKTRSGRLRPHPTIGPLVSELFRRRAEGDSISALARWLESQSVLTSKGNPGWAYASVRHVLRNPVYLGAVRSGHYVRERAHPPLIDPATWQLAQRPRQPAPAVDRGPALLAGVARCAGCGHPVSAQGGPDKARSGPDPRAYACVAHYASGRCSAPAYIRASQLEPFVVNAVMQLLARRRRRPDVQLRAAANAATNAERMLGAYRDSDRLFNILGEERFAAGLQARTDRVRETRLALAAAQAKHAVHDLPAAREVAATWDEMDILEQRTIVRAVIDCLFVQRGRKRPEERVWIIPAGSGPSDLPSRRDRRSRMRPFVPPASAAATRAEPLVEWEPAVLRQRLRDFTRGRAAWPEASDFRRHGRHALYLQCVFQGGERYWARELGLVFLRRNQEAMRWSEERVRASLRVFLRDKSCWPPHQEFTKAGLGTLHTAVCRYGGVARWAAEFSMPFVEHPRGYWTEDAIRRTLVAFCTDRAYFPSRSEFKAAHLGGLLGTMQNGRGVQAWADELGLCRDPRSNYRPPRSCVASGSAGA
jgi:site-specific DNA recombinase